MQIMDIEAVFNIYYSVFLQDNNASHGLYIPGPLFTLCIVGNIRKRFIR